MIEQLMKLTANGPVTTPSITGPSHFLEEMPSTRASMARSQVLSVGFEKKEDYKVKKRQIAHETEEQFQKLTHVRDREVPELLRKFGQLYQGSNKRDQLQRLDIEVTRQQDALRKAKIQSKRIAAKKLTKEGSLMEKLCEMMAEIEELKVKSQQASTACQIRYDIHQRP